MDQLTVAVFGAAGYGGVELLRLLRRHPRVEVRMLAGHTTAGQRMDRVYPHLIGEECRTIADSDVKAACEAADLLFFALPHGAGMDMVAAALEAGKRVVDFSADYRLRDQAAYEQYYGPHSHPELLPSAVYGLPELHRDEIRDARLVAVPGCYPTGAILALAPAVREGLVDPTSIIIDAKSGVSGAGRTKLTLTTHFAEVNESLTAYSIATHRHTPEMEQELSLWGQPVRVTFSPHLIPVTRGILTTAYATLRTRALLEEVHELYVSSYDREPFVHVLPPGEYPATKHVTGTNFCNIGLTMDERAGRLVVVSAIDNLGKGLSAAAVQCLNIMYGWPETMALEDVAIWP